MTDNMFWCKGTDKDFDVNFEKGSKLKLRKKESNRKRFKKVKISDGTLYMEIDGIFRIIGEQQLENMLNNLSDRAESLEYKLQSQEM